MSKIIHLVGSKVWRQLIRLSIFACLLAFSPVHAQNDAHQVLVERGEYWLEKGDIERANEAWEKLLLLNSNNSRAFRGLAETALRANQVQKAKEYVDKLKKTDPKNAAIAGLEQQVLLRSKSGTSSLVKARQKAKQGNMQAAIEQYKELLKGQTPSGDLGREYYTYLGYSEGGLAEAITGLKRLEKENPSDVQISLALARHLARQSQTRPEAIERLVKLSKREDVGREAVKSWREAVLWLGPPNKAQEVYFQRFLERFPDDAEVKAQLTDGRKRSVTAAAPARVDPLVQRTQKALKELDAHPEQAENDFLAVLKQRPNEVNALGGLGVIRLRQGRVGEAVQLLQRASQQRGGNRWQQALSQAKRQEFIEKAQQLQRQGNTQEAEQQYMKILEEDPSNLIALNELVGLFVAQGELEQAQNYLSKLDPLMRQNTSDANLQAAYKVTVAKFDLARGDPQLAQAELELALISFPSDPWIRLELARIYLLQANINEADQVMQGVVVSPQAPLDNLKAVALYAAEKKNWAQVLHTLSSVDAKRLDADLVRLQKQADFHQQILWAKQRCEFGQIAPALNALSQKVLDLKDDFSLVSALVDAFVECKNTNMALMLLDRQILVADEQQAIELKLLRVGVLFQDEQIVQAEQLMAQIGQQLLTATQKQSYDEMARYLAIKQAQLLRAYGREQQALEVLLPWLETSISDLGLATLAIELYLDVNKPQLAQRLYNATLSKSYLEDSYTDNINIARLAYRIGDTRRGDTVLEQVAAQAGDNETILVKVAKTYREAGRMSKAAKVIKKAMAPYN